jgi:hypothetical protein
MNHAAFFGKNIACVALTLPSLVMYVCKTEHDKNERQYKHFKNMLTEFNVPSDLHANNSNPFIKNYASFILKSAHLEATAKTKKNFWKTNAVKE